MAANNFLQLRLSYTEISADEMEAFGITFNPSTEEFHYDPLMLLNLANTYPVFGSERPKPYYPAHVTPPDEEAKIMVKAKATAVTAAAKLKAAQSYFGTILKKAVTDYPTFKRNLNLLLNGLDKVLSQNAQGIQFRKSYWRAKDAYLDLERTINGNSELVPDHFPLIITVTQNVENVYEIANGERLLLAPSNDFKNAYIYILNYVSTYPDAQSALETATKADMRCQKCIIGYYCFSQNQKKYLQNTF